MSKKILILCFAVVFSLNPSISLWGEEGGATPVQEGAANPAVPTVVVDAAQPAVTPPTQVEAPTRPPSLEEMEQPLSPPEAEPTREQPTSRPEATPRMTQREERRVVRREAIRRMTEEYGIPLKEISGFSLRRRTTPGENASDTYAQYAARFTFRGRLFEMRVEVDRDRNGVYFPDDPAGWPPTTDLNGDGRINDTDHTYNLGVRDTLEKTADPEKFHNRFLVIPPRKKFNYYYGPEGAPRTFTLIDPTVPPGKEAESAKDIFVGGESRYVWWGEVESVRGDPEPYGRLVAFADVDNPFRVEVHSKLVPDPVFGASYGQVSELVVHDGGRSVRIVNGLGDADIYDSADPSANPASQFFTAAFSGLQATRDIWSEVVFGSSPPYQPVLRLTNHEADNPRRLYQLSFSYQTESSARYETPSRQRRVSYEVAQRLVLFPLPPYITPDQILRRYVRKIR